jgi:hypothetical protein
MRHKESTTIKIKYGSLSNIFMAVSHKVTQYHGVPALHDYLPISLNFKLKHCQAVSGVAFSIALQ